MSAEFRPERFIEILEEIRAMLLKYRFGDEIVSELLEAVRSGREKFAWTLRYRGVWGASGSLSDVLFNGNVRGVPRLQLHRDDVEYGRLMLRLGEEAIAQGMGWASLEKEGENDRDVIDRYDRVHAAGELTETERFLQDLDRRQPNI
jgi:hypothetical protein